MVLLILNNCMTIHIVVCYINLIFRCQNIKIKIDVTELLIEKKTQILKKEKSHQGVQWQAPLMIVIFIPSLIVMFLGTYSGSGFFSNKRLKICKLL